MAEAKKDKPRKRTPAYRLEKREGSVSSVSDAFSEIATLGEEMREGYDNMEGNNMGHLEKCERMGEAADALEGISEVEAPDCVADLPMTYGESVPTRKGRGTSRATRLSNAVAILQAAIEACQEADLVEDDAAERDDFVTELENVVSEAENVEFPGMYG